MQVVRHDAISGLYDDKLYQISTEKVYYYVQYAEGRKGEGLEPILQCPQTVDWLKVILISVGSGCGLFAIGFIVYFVVVNLKDYLELRDFKKKQDKIWSSEFVVEPEMSKSDSQKRKSVRNRLSVKFSNK